MSLPAPRMPDAEWKREAKRQIDPFISGYPHPQFASDPANVRPSYTYYNTTSNKLRCFDGTVFNDLW